MAVITGNVKSLPGAAMLAQGRVQYVENYVDFAANPCSTTTDEVDVFDVSANTMVLAIGYEIITAGTTSATFALGFDGGTTLLTTGQALDAAAGTMAQAGALTSSNVATSAGEITMKMAAATAVAGKVRIWAVLFNYDAI